MPDPAKDSAKIPLVQLNGIDRYYEERGSGDALLLINGLGGNALSWEPLLPDLAAHFRVITSDNRGVGRSAAPPGPYTTRQMADDAAALLAHLGVERAHVVGSSMGGMIAQELALTYPTLVGRLVLFATYARPHLAIIGPWLSFIKESMDRGCDSAGLRALGLGWWYSPAFLADPDRVEEALAWQEPYPAPAHGIAAQAEAARAHDTLDRLSQITAPTLILVGAEDIFTPLYYSRELAAGIPGAQLRVLERGGHSALWEYPVAGAAALLAFLASPTVDRAS